MVAIVAAIVVALFIALLVIGAAVGRQTANPAAVFTDPSGRFSAAYQNQPTKKDQSATVNGRAINQTLWSDAIDSNTAEAVGYTDFPSDFTVTDPHNALDGGVNGEVRKTGGSLVSKIFGTYQGFPSVDALISASGGYLDTRAVLAGRTLYIVVVTATNNPPELFSSFVNSLHILTHAG